MKAPSEKSLTEAVCAYLRLKYKDCIFTIDSSGLRVTLNQAMQLKRLRSSRGLPDIMIFEPRGKYHGLFLELKKDGTRLRKKNGDYANEHIKEQEIMLARLNEKGYAAMFAIGFEAARNIIDEYFNFK